MFGYATTEHQDKLPALAGFIFQNPEHQIIFPTVLEEVAFGLEQLGYSSSEAQLQAREFLQLYRIEDLADRPGSESVRGAETADLHTGCACYES